MFSNKSLPASNTVVGFDSLPSNVMAYLIERHPDQIPDKIMRLAPNPADAFSRFFVGLARGHLTACNHDVSPVRAA